MPQAERKLLRVSSTARRGVPAPRTMLRAVGTERSARVYQELRELIVDGRLAPGSRIVERDLVDLLGVSRTPVRTALHRLQQEGYVIGLHRGHRQRLIVTPLTQEDATELLEMVGALEGIALRRVARLDPAERRVIIDRLRRINSTFAKIANGRHPDPRRMSAIDEAFHRTFVVRGAGARLLAMHESLQPQTYRLRRLHHYRARELTPQSIDEHNEIIAAIERGDARGAMLSGQKNWQNAAVRVGEVLTRLGEYGKL